MGDCVRAPGSDWVGAVSPNEDMGGLGQVGLEEAQTLSGGIGFQAASHVELAIDAADLALNRIGRDHERLGHLRVGLPGNEQAQDFLFPPGEGGHEPTESGAKACDNGRRSAVRAGISTGATLVSCRGASVGKAARTGYSAQFARAQNPRFT